MQAEHVWKSKGLNIIEIRWNPTCIQVLYLTNHGIKKSSSEQIQAEIIYGCIRGESKGRELVTTFIEEVRKGPR